MRFVTKDDIDQAEQELTYLTTGALNVHDSLFEIGESVSGIEPLANVYEKFRDELDLSWQNGADVTKHSECVQRFVNIAMETLRQLESIND